MCIDFAPGMYPCLAGTCPYPGNTTADKTSTYGGCSMALASATGTSFKIVFRGSVPTSTNGCTTAKSSLGGYIESGSVQLSAGQRLQFRYQGQ